MFIGKLLRSIGIFLIVAGLLTACGDDTTYNYVDPNAESGSQAKPGSDSDITPPQIANVGSTSNTTVVISFTEPMGAGADNPVNYQITRLSLCEDSSRDGIRLNVITVVLNDDKTSVTLTTQPQTEFTYRVGVGNISDLAGNLIKYPEFYINPLIPTFAGTPSTGSRIDTDGDGLSDAEEQFGWAVRVTLADGTATCRDVTSDPNTQDSDSDGLSDAEEQNRTTNPRDDDTDNDSLNDYAEANVYWSNYLAQDTDGDTLLDGDEVNILNTSPALADTDGDNYSDFEEIFQRSSHPLIADLPKAELELVGEATIKLDVKYTDGTTYSTQVEDSFADESAFTTRKTETTVQKMTGLKDFSLNPIGLFSGLKTLFSGGGTSDLNKMFQEKETSTTEETTQSHRNAHANLVANGQNRTEEVSSGFIKMGIQVRNTGDISFKLNNLAVSVLQRDPFSHKTTRVLATLKPSVPDLTLGPGGETGPLLIEEAAAPASLVKDLLANPTSLLFEVATFDLEDAEGRNFAFLSEVTHSRTALVTIDYNDGRIDRYRVATDVKRNLDGSSAGITMDEVLSKILNINYATVADKSLLDDGTTSNETVLTTVKDVTSNLAQKKFWMVIGSREGHVAANQNFEDIVLKGGDSIVLAFVTDEDGDGLIARDEFMFGTKDTDPDTDGDGLTDYEEVKVGWVVTTDKPYQVYSDPRTADSDRDGLLDPEECGVDADGIVLRDSEGNLACVVNTDPSSFDTDKDGLCDGPGRLDNFDPLSPYYICRLGAPQDNNPLEPALFWPPSLLAISPTPNELVVNLNANLTVVFDQKMDAASQFYAHGSLSGRLPGSINYAINPDGSVNLRSFILDFYQDYKPGEEIEISLGPDVKNIDLFTLANPYIYRYRAATTDTGSGGLFRSAPAYTLNEVNATYMESADWDKDGDIDLVVAYGTSGTYGVTVMLNNGNGDYSEKASYSTAGSPEQIVVADFNSDGAMDFALSTTLPAEAVVYFNDGSANFTASVYSFEDDSLLDNAQSLATGDLDGDGDMDIVVALTDIYLSPLFPGSFAIEGVVVILTNTGTGSFTQNDVRMGLLSALSTVEAADLDNDDDIDLFFSGGWTENVNAVWINDGSGSFTITTGTTSAVGLGHLRFGDMDGDGDLDAVGNVNGQLSILPNNGDASFAPPINLGVGSHPNPVALVDYDKDGDLDIGGAFSYLGISLLKNDGAANFETYGPYQVGYSPRFIAAGDVNADGDIDFIGYGQDASTSSQIAVMHQIAPNTFYALKPLRMNEQPHATRSGDLDGDGDVDFIASSISNIYVFVNKGNGIFEDPVSYSAGGSGEDIMLADFDADGDLDVVTGRGSVLLNNGDATFAAAVSYYTPGSASVVTGDFDGDGDQDFVLADYNTKNIVLLRNDGLGSFATPELYPAGSFPLHVIAGDVDGDGDLDLIASGLVLLLNQGNGVFDAPVELFSASISRAMELADVDNDGDVDLLFAVGYTGYLFVYFNNGSGDFGASARFALGEGPSNLALGDIDGDGDLDVAVTEGGSHDMRVLFNNGKGHYTPAGRYMLSGPEALTLADFDGDKDLDITAVDGTGSRFVWILLNEIPKR